MKHYKVIENDRVTQFAKQPNNIIPSFAVEITSEEYMKLRTDFDTRQAIIADYMAKVESGEMALDEVPEDYRSEINIGTDDEATEADYIDALSELGVDISEEV